MLKHVEEKRMAIAKANALDAECLDLQQKNKDLEAKVQRMAKEAELREVSLSQSKQDVQDGYDGLVKLEKKYNDAMQQLKLTKYAAEKYQQQNEELQATLRVSQQTNDEQQK